jgi:hypothetical protein
LLSNSIDYSNDYSGYFDPTNAQQKAVVFFINKIISQETGNILLVAIPTPEDFKRVKNGYKKNEMLWWRSFTSFEKNGKGKVNFVDLIDYPPTDVSDLYLSCDGHWSPFGNEWAAKIISHKLSTLR